MKCEFCGFEFDDACGRYGCSNCLAEGLDGEDEAYEKRRQEEIDDGDSLRNTLKDIAGAAS